MRLLLGLLENETLKVLRRKRFRLVLIVLFGILVLIAFAQSRNQAFAKKNAGADWRPSVARRVASLDRQSASGRAPEAFVRMMKFEAARLRYHLSHDVRPDVLTGPAFCRAFAGSGSVLLLPLLVAIFASDLVSAELSEGTLPLLLTRPVSRWKILVSKLLAMALFTTLTIAAAVVMAYLVGSVPFGWKGFGAPMLGGFRLGEGGIDPDAVRVIPLWQDTLAAWGLAWYASICVGTISVLLSILFRAAAAAMGTMMATLVAGTILSRIASDWVGAKWLFVSCLPLAEFYAGVPPPVPGMTLGFCAAVLGGWAGAALLASFLIFTKRDVTA